MNSNSIWQPHQPKFSNQLDLKIDDPSLYYCVIYKYIQGHRELAITVRKHRDDPEVMFYFVFESIWYFQGPTSWHGIDFEFADINERKILLQKIFLDIKDNMLDSFSQRYALYVIHNPGITIQILAGNCFTLKSIPASSSTSIE